MRATRCTRLRRSIMEERSADNSISSFAGLAGELAEIGQGFFKRGWVLGTSGNFSAVVARQPLRLAITPSGADKGRLATGDILLIDDDGRVLSGSGRPSAETLLHMSVVARHGAGAVLHTHSVWSNILSEAYFQKSGFA